MSSEFVKTLSAADVTESALAGQGLVLVDFWATWCGPCRMVAPIIDQLAEEYRGKVTIGKLDVDEHPQGAIAYGVGSIPTMILFKDGQVVEKVVGARGKPALMEMLEKHIVR